MLRPTALIIDDEPGIAQVALDVAIDCGYNAQIVTSGALVNAAVNVPDVIVLDLLMPGTDGVEVLRSIAAAGWRTQIILMSGMSRRMLDSARKVATVQNLSVAGVLNKPFRPAELRDLLTGIIATTTNSVEKKMRASQVLVTVEDLARAIAHDELVIHYQPKLNLADESWIGVEALVRWQHPVHGLLYPDAFIHIAVASELALPFTYELARKAVADCAVMSATMGFEGSLAINIPPSALTEATVPERLLEIISGSEIEPSRLVVEITETSIASGQALSLDILTRLRMRGIRLSIDDFGIGHSSLERLYETPFDELKIDMMFLRGAEHDPALRTIVESTISLGHGLGMVVAAEGVENAEVLAWLTRIGCDYAQGYHISRPVPLNALGQWAKLRVAAHGSAGRDALLTVVKHDEAGGALLCSPSAPMKQI
jgi:EAL domain-containing protein (putative c-di-GMP-specific phosphodiesterase class I)/FixJ family two-component response regulator